MSWSFTINGHLETSGPELAEQMEKVVEIAKRAAQACADLGGATVTLSGISQDPDKPFGHAQFNAGEG